jgi:hypothetical protein
MSGRGPACVGEPVSWLRLERYHLGELGAAEREAIARHLEACPACRACVARIEADDAVALPPLTLPAKAPAHVPRVRRAGAWQAWPVAFAALAAAVMVVVVRIPGRGAPSGATGARSKGGAIAFSLVRDDGQRFDDMEGTFRDGDRFKALVTCPAEPGNPWFDLVVFDRDGASFPLEPLALAGCGNDVPLPGAFRLTGRGRESVCLVWSDDGPVDRARLARTDPGLLPSATCKALEPSLR